MAIFTLPQIGERNGVKTRTKFWKESLFFACFARGSGLFCYVFASSKCGMGKDLLVNDLLRRFELKFL